MRRRNNKRVIAIVFLLIFFPSILPFNLLYGSNHTPGAPEAASFEPVDSTDMVNLLTGGCSYVLPLLNVPSPEGGYPLSLAYHAGIAMDQEASWTGLGWNVNPGAINRNVNGLPDDYKASRIDEFFYDEGEQIEIHNVSVGYSCGVVSVGLGASWGSFQASGGFVSMGVGPDTGFAGFGVKATIGTHGNAVSAGYTTAGGLFVGAGVSDSGGFSLNTGSSFDSNSQGFNIGYSSAQGLSVGFASENGSIGVSLSSKNLGGSINGAGIGISTGFNNSINIGDYAVKSGNTNIALVIPTPIGMFNFGYGKQTITISLAKSKYNVATGPVHFNSEIKTHWVNSLAILYNNLGQGSLHSIGRQAFALMDVYELGTCSPPAPYHHSPFNVPLPTFDNFTVQAQGISGNMSVALAENGNLFGPDNTQSYPVNGAFAYANALSQDLTFEGKPQFYFKNENAQYLEVAEAVLNHSIDLNTDIRQFVNLGSVTLNELPRRRTSNHIEYFTNREIKNNILESKSRGYLDPNIHLNRLDLPEDGIGAFKITTPDGKTYHYSIPVYNHEIITRTFGMIEDRPHEAQAYFEKRQLEPYATHWLLTAVTGPDFVDNGDGIAGGGDMGYWVNFEYGKVSDAFAWSAPYKKPYIEDEETPGIKTTIKGRKQLYYLDRVNTRTHTALFIKSPRLDAASPSSNYYSVPHIEGGRFQTSSYNHYFSIPSQVQYKLDKIILIKNEDNELVANSAGAEPGTSVTVTYPQSTKENVVAYYNDKNAILDNNDNWNLAIPKAIKVIDFTYDNSLVPGDNRLTLKKVNFKGKQGANVLPPYTFDYHNSTSNFDIKKMEDGWGYYNLAPHTWSLKTITTPQGAKININYENNVFKSATPHDLTFSNKNNARFKANFPAFSSMYDIYQKKFIIDIGSNSNYNIEVGTEVEVRFLFRTCLFGVEYKAYYGYQPASTNMSTFTDPSAHISNVLGGGKFEVTLENNVLMIQNSPPGSICSYTHAQAEASAALDNNWTNWHINAKIKVNPDVEITGGGSRVKSIEVVDGNSKYITEYKYGENENGVGHVSYIPHSPNAAKEVKMSSELPTPRVIYEYVTVKAMGQDGSSSGKTKYKFNVIKSRSQYNQCPDLAYGPQNINQSANANQQLYSIDQNDHGKTFASPSYHGAHTQYITIHDNLSAYGRLEEVTTYNSFGHELSKIANEYYARDQSPNNIGVVQEAYQSYQTRNNYWTINSVKRVSYPNILKSTTEYRDGYTYKTEYLDYDPLSGVAREQVFTSSEVREFKKRIVPAYIKYAGMGNKADNIANKHMLTQTAVEYSYIWDGGTWKETGVGITTWKNEWEYVNIEGTYVPTYSSDQNVWRKHSTYIWNGLKDSNGIFLSYANSDGNDDGFNWAIGEGTQPSQWRKISEVTKYDHYSTAIEIKDINNNLMSLKKGDKETKVLSSGNAGYSEMFYSGAEYIANSVSEQGVQYLEPEVRFAGAIRISNPAYVHTGNYSVATTSTSQFGVNMKSGQHRAGRYKLSVWVHKDNVAKARVRLPDSGLTQEFNGESYSAGSWVLKTHYLNNVPTGAFKVHVNSIDQTTVYYDDLRLHPVASTMTCYVYNKWDELTHIIGASGLATQYAYDTSGRLIRTYIEVVDDPDNGMPVGGFKTTSTTQYFNKNLE